MFNFIQQCNKTLLIVLLFIFSFNFSQFVNANQNISILPAPPKELPFILELIKRNDTDETKTKKTNAVIEETDDSYVFRQTFQNPADASKLQVMTMFQKGIETIDKRVLLKKGDYNATFFTRLASPKENFTVSLRRREKEGDILIFDGKTDIFLYTFSINEDDSSDLKEWIYAREPNSAMGTGYSWKFGSVDPTKKLRLHPNEDGSISILSSTGNPMDTDVDSSMENTLARIPPLRYWTSSGIQRDAQMYVDENNTLTITVAESKESFPILIDQRLYLLNQ